MGFVIEYQDIKTNLRFNPVIGNLVKSLIKEENKELGEVTVILTGNSRILEINRTFLKHDYFTDVITFPDVKRKQVSGDIFISLDQVLINSKKFNTDYFEEILRVIIHGILHLIGYNDINESEKIEIRKREDHYLCKFKQFEIVKSERSL